MMVPSSSMRSACALCLFSMCLLGQAFAFVLVPSTARVAPVSPFSAATSTLSRTPGASGMVMRAAKVSPFAESAVAGYKKYVGSKRWEAMDQPKERATDTFQEICNVYGEDNAVKMAKDVPSCLGYDPTNFQATFEAFSGVFTPEDTKGMVTRNPNLLSVRPTGFGGACNAKSDTMTISYIIAFTRPIGPVLLYGLLFLISVPFVEAGTGISREDLLSAVVSKFSG